MIVVKLQQHGTICTVNTSPNGYDGYTPPMPGDGTIGNEDDVWAKGYKNSNLWDDEW